MFSVHTVLFATDLTERDLPVFHLACSLARDCGARVVVLHVMPPPFGPDEIEARHRPDEYYGGARQALHRLQPPGQNVRVEYQLAVGDPADEIAATAREVGAGLVVIGTHGRSGPGRLLLGSVAEAVLRMGPCPVLTARVPFRARPPASNSEGRTEGTVLWPIRTVLCPVDLSDDSREAFDVACALTRDNGARVIVLHVTSVTDLAYGGYVAPGSRLAEQDILAEARRRLTGLQPPDPRAAVEHRVVEGDPAGEILRVAAESGADVIVMGTHGRTGLRHLLLGSVAEQVVRKAACPVLTLRAAAK